MNLTKEKIADCVKHLKHEQPNTYAIYMVMLDRIHKESMLKFENEQKSLRRTLHVFSQNVINHQWQYGKELG